MGRRIFFDIDRTLVDSNVIRRNGIGLLSEKTRLKKFQIVALTKEYQAGLSHKNKYNPWKLAEFVEKNTGGDNLGEIYINKEVYEGSVYPRTKEYLGRLKKVGYELGIFSEGNYQYQINKLKFGGLSDLFDPKLLIILDKKCRKEAVGKMAGGVVVDDCREVISYLTRFGDIRPIWLNRKKEPEVEGVATIYSLEELEKCL